MATKSATEPYWTLAQAVLWFRTRDRDLVDRLGFRGSMLRARILAEQGVWAPPPPPVPETAAERQQRRRELIALEQAGKLFGMPAGGSELEKIVIASVSSMIPIFSSMTPRCARCGSGRNRGAR